MYDTVSQFYTRVCSPFQPTCPLQRQCGIHVGEMVKGEHFGLTITYRSRRLPFEYNATQNVSALSLIN